MIHTIRRLLFRLIPHRHIWCLWVEGGQFGEWCRRCGEVRGLVREDGHDG